MPPTRSRVGWDVVKRKPTNGVRALPSLPPSLPQAVVKAPGRILIPLTNPWRAGAPPSGAELAGRVSEAACSSGGEAAAAAGPQATGAAAAAGAEDSAAAPDSKRRKLEAAGASSAGAGSHADASGGAAPRGGETGAGDAAAGPSSEADAAAALFARVPGLSFPATRLERIRMSVFADLSKRGYYLSTGAKFGSDFLAYPGARDICTHPPAPSAFPQSSSHISASAARLVIAVALARGRLAAPSP